MTGEDVNTCCHSNLVRAAVGDGLEEGDVHVVLNVFMCTPISTSTSPSPVRWRRAITSNSWPRSTLLVSALTRPRCDVSVACGDRGGVPVCYPLTVEIYKPREGWLEGRGWSSSEVSGYGGDHGLRCSVAVDVDADAVPPP
jgi:hypothetical protein